MKKNVQTFSHDVALYSINRSYKHKHQYSTQSKLNKKIVTLEIETCNKPLPDKFFIELSILVAKYCLP